MYYHTVIDYVIEGRVEGREFKATAHKLTEGGCQVEVRTKEGTQLVGKYEVAPWEALDRAVNDVFPQLSRDRS